MMRVFLFLLLMLVQLPAIADNLVRSGFFFDAEHDGEGFVIDVLSADQATVYWFTYDEDGNQRWFLGVGTLTEQGIRVDEWVVTRGGRFGDAFDPADVEFSVAGSARFQVNHCDSITVSYTIDGVDGQQQLQRLSSVADAACNGLKSHRSGLGGAFFDPERNGEGIILHVIGERRALMVYFGYNQNGDQMWVLGDGDIQGDTLVLEAPFTTSGGRFGEDYDPGSVAYTPWGDMSLTLGCDGNHLDYSAIDDGLGDGTFDFQRLNGQLGPSCDEGSTHELKQLSCEDYQRQLLTSTYFAAQLNSQPVPTREFLPTSNCAPALHSFEGTLRLSGGNYTEQGNGNISQQTFPAFETEFTSVEGRIIPVNPDLIRTELNSIWRFVFGAGQSWSEPEDNGWSRASIPFTMSHQQWNAARHGLFSFLYRDDEISGVQFQVSQENVPWEGDVDYFGVINAQWSTHEPIDAYSGERAWRRDMAMRFDTAPMSDLIGQVGGVAFTEFNRGVPEHKMSQAGILVDDTLYYQDAYTRAGDHPFPEEMRHGAFSVTKTAGAAVAMLYLAQAYGEEVFDELIRDHIEVTASHNGWDQVTFGDTLSMVVGVGDAQPTATASATFADENDFSSSTWALFNNSLNLDKRLEGAFGFGNFPWGPAQVMRYNSAHTMILAVAMDNFLKSKEGEGADLWETLNRAVYQPIGIRWLPSMRLNYDSNTPGPVPMGWGLVLSIHDAARVAQLLQNDGVFKGQQLLHPAKTRQTLRLDQDQAWWTPEQTQLSTNTWVGTQYIYGTWSSPVSVSPNCQAIGSRMEGLGGNFVVMLPSGISVFRFADANVYDPGALVVTAERIRSSCSP